MKRLIKIIAAAVILTFSANVGAVFAVDERLVFTELFECRGNVYFLDPNTDTVVLRNLSYSEISDESLKADIKYLIEYSEIPVLKKGISAVGRGKISADTVNSEYADAKVRVVIAKNKKGYKVVNMLCGID